MTTNPPTDQSRLAKSRLLVADAFTRARTDTAPDPHDLATWLLEQLQELGWKAPPDPATDIPPLRPARIATDDSPGRREYRATLCDRFGHQPDPDRCRRCNTATTAA